MLSRKNAAELLAYTSYLINGERAQSYGEPQQSFEKIAKLWSTYLHTEITVTDVGMMMILLKVARNGRGKDKDDNFVDICGYASLAGSAVFKPPEHVDYRSPSDLSKDFDKKYYKGKNESDKEPEGNFSSTGKVER